MGGRCPCHQAHDMGLQCEHELVHDKTLIADKFDKRWFQDNTFQELFPDLLADRFVNPIVSTNICQVVYRQFHPNRLYLNVMMIRVPCRNVIWI